MLARIARVPVVVSHEHGSALEGKRLRTFLDREVVARFSTVMIAVSDWDRENLIAKERISPELIRVFPNGIDEPDASSEPGAPVLARTDDTHLIGAVGRLYPEKGYTELIRAVAMLRDRGYKLQCVILGDGPQEAALSDLIDVGELENVHARNKQEVGRRLALIAKANSTRAKDD